MGEWVLLILTLTAPGTLTVERAGTFPDVLACRTQTVYQDPAPLDMRSPRLWFSVRVGEAVKVCVRGRDA